MSFGHFLGGAAILGAEVGVVNGLMSAGGS